MTIVHSAGLILFRSAARGVEILLVHPGGPFWSKKDDGAWSIPKGECGGAEALIDAARREFAEETGTPPPEGNLIALLPVRQPSGKIIHAWAIRGNFDVSALKSNKFTIEWPPHSGRKQEFAEVDRAEWFPMVLAKNKIFAGQLPLLTQLESHLKRDGVGKIAAS